LWPVVHELADVCRRALHELPGERYPSAAEFAAALERCVGELAMR
jgi:hypothetical protein